ncbi:transcription factor IIA, alpha/beta subunit [Microdochium bolleyi]|uniref:Transcription factor IIA, alpha/beta subunit n=1 Tax=Microdochium bolleyi TaxID=196109 RepID=A0A136J2P3_9PEZI|nr:transcription factor IIA, alpha/beta subunit [Microdochium bolleyi]
MSNNQVGSVYQQIIQDVIDSSRVDFEEGGIDEGVLEELKKTWSPARAAIKTHAGVTTLRKTSPAVSVLVFGWQKKLSQQQLAVFPWDPKPDPPAPAQSTAPQSSAPMQQAAAPSAGIDLNGGMYAPQNGSSASGLPMPGMSQTTAHFKPEPGVKMEPGMENAGMGNFADSNTVAQQRVIDQLQNQYGERAAGSIEKLKGSFTTNNGAQGQQRPGVPMPQPNQYQGNGQLQQPPPSQLDGADDHEGIGGILMYQSASGQQTEMGRMEIDSLLHAQIAANARAMEGGGFMVPLKKSRKSAKLSQPRTSAAMGGPSQFDGGDDDDDLKDDEEDEDAINSDLDDPDENPDDDDEDEDGGQIMLCMYDKVQRVKNKWKCVLKDGVLSINGKDYVFHKATGEYEW